MVYRSELNNWINGNISDLDRESLIRIARYFEIVAEHGYMFADDYIDEDEDD